MRLCVTSWHRQNVFEVLACTWRYHFLKSKLKEPLMFLFSLDMRRGKFTNLSSLVTRGNKFLYWIACFHWIMTVRDIKLRKRLSKKTKHILIYVVIFSHFRSWSIRESAHVNVCVKVQTISRLDSQIRLKMITLFCGRHVGVPQRCTNMAAPLGSINLWKIFRRISEAKKNAQTSNVDKYLLY